MPSVTPPRAEFMALLDEHEAVVAELQRAIVERVSFAEQLDRFRASRRMLVAAFDRATIHLTPGAKVS